MFDQTYWHMTDLVQGYGCFVHIHTYIHNVILPLLPKQLVAMTPFVCKQ